MEGPEETPSVSEAAAVSWDRPCPGCQVQTQVAPGPSAGEGPQGHPGSLPGLPPCSVHPMASGLQLTVRSGLCMSPGQREAGRVCGQEPQLGWPGLLFTTAQSPAGSKSGACVLWGPHRTVTQDVSVLGSHRESTGCGHLKKCPNPSREAWYSLGLTHLNVGVG